MAPKTITLRPKENPLAEVEIDFQEIYSYLDGGVDDGINLDWTEKELKRFADAISKISRAAKDKRNIGMLKKCEFFVLFFGFLP